MKPINFGILGVAIGLLIVSLLIRAGVTDPVYRLEVRHTEVDPALRSIAAELDIQARARAEEVAQLKEKVEILSRLDPLTLGTSRYRPGQRVYIADPGRRELTGTIVRLRYMVVTQHDPAVSCVTDLVYDVAADGGAVIPCHDADLAPLSR